MTRLVAFILAVTLSLAVAAPAIARPDRFATHLPLIEIDLRAPIPDEPKVTGRMGVIDRPGRRLNRPGDRPSVYRGWIGIELRGHWSQAWPKKSFSLGRTAPGRDPGGNALRAGPLHSRVAGSARPDCLLDSDRRRQAASTEARARVARVLFRGPGRSAGVAVSVTDADGLSGADSVAVDVSYREAPAGTSPF
jgi:hypothetical protein